MCWIVPLLGIHDTFIHCMALQCVSYWNRVPSWWYWVLSHWNCHSNSNAQCTVIMLRQKDVSSGFNIFEQIMNMWKVSKFLKISYDFFIRCLCAKSKTIRVCENWLWDYSMLFMTQSHGLHCQISQTESFLLYIYICIYIYIEFYLFISFFIICLNDYSSTY